MHLRGGHGGSGSASFRREPFVPRGGPDGGDGGRGGSVLVRATTEVSDLSEYLRRPRWQAAPGRDGAPGRKTGSRGADLVLEVPVGTLVIDEAGGLIADLDRPGASHEVVSGGRGGRGNVHFKSSTRRAPDHAETGEKGAEMSVALDLKLIADAGLVGPPNAGKSSLLRALTAARPKVAAYPFTTLDPVLGVMDEAETRIVVADIPGLVEGAADGAGLGIRFLRHIERTKALIYVIDGATPDPWADLAAVRAEVARFSAELSMARPYLIAVNKLDLAETRALMVNTRKRRTHFVSALSGEGIPALKSAIVEAVANAQEPRLRLVGPAVTELPSSAPRLSVRRHAWGFRVSGDRVERLVEQTNFDSQAAVDRFQLLLDRLGVNAALESAGARPGDSVRIGDTEFEYQP